MRIDRLMDIMALLVGVAAIVLMVDVVWNRSSVRAANGKEHNVEVPDWRQYIAQGRTLGPATAPVTILEFGDYECPACRHFHGTLEAVMAAFGDSVTVVYRHFPLERHLLGQTAARAAECAADQGRFVPYHNLLYENSSWLALGSRAFELYARGVGVPDSARFAECLFSLDDMKSLSSDWDAGLALGVQGTPTIMVNDLLLGGVPDSATLSGLVREALDATN